MRREYKLIAALALLVCVVILACVQMTSGVLTMYIEIPDEADGATVSSSDADIINADEVYTENKLLALKLREYSKGSSVIYIDWMSESGEDLDIYDLALPVKTNFLGGITETLTGDFSGWQGSVAAVTVFFIVTCVLLLRVYAKRRRTELYSYTTVFIAGSALFTASVAFVFIRYMLMCLTDKTMSLWSLYIRMLTVSQSFVIWTAPPVIVFMLALVISNAELLRCEGFNLTNLLGIIVSVILIGAHALAALMIKTNTTFIANMSQRNLICNVYSSMLCYFECMLFASALCAYAAARLEPAGSIDYIVILGCKIRQDGTLLPLLKGRVDRALEFARRQQSATGKLPVFVPSGGQGSDECISESEAMARYLRSNGVPENKILKEDKSSSTYENINFSKKLIDAEDPDATTAVCTTNYHVFRAGMIAAEAGWKVQGLGARTKWYFWPNAFVREFAGLIISRAGAHIRNFVLMCLFFAIISMLV